MTKRRLFWLIAVPVLLAFVVWLEPTRVAWGLMTGEAFYDSRPTSYWRQELSRWELFMTELGIGRGHEYWKRERSQFDRWLDRFRDAPDHLWGRPAILRGDPNAEHVLNELRDDPSAPVRENAAIGLAAIREPESRLLPQWLP